MSFNLKTVSVPSEYAIKSYADFRLIGSGGTIRLKRVAEDKTESFSQLVLASDSKSLLSDPKDLVVLEAIVFLASRPNLLSDPKSTEVQQTYIKTEDHKTLLASVLEFRKSGTFPTVVGNTGLAFVPVTVAAEKATGTGLSAAQILAEARSGRSSSSGTTAFRRSRNIS
jgi:hypothetical protein